jgi:enediyne biosynthesis protein E4
VTNFDLETHSVFRNLGGGIFADATAASGVDPPTLPFVGFGTAWFDGDNDGDLDLAIANGHVLDNPGVFRAGARHAQRTLLFVNDGRGSFSETRRSARPALQPERVSRGLFVADIDNDGALDMLITNNGQPVDLCETTAETSATPSSCVSSARKAIETADEWSAPRGSTATGAWCCAHLSTRRVRGGNGGAQ